MTHDEQEALSCVYNVARIVRLSSGALALFSPYSGGMEIISIGSIEDIAPLIPSSSEVAAWVDDRRAEERTLSTFERKEARTLIEKLGLTKPQAPLVRRF